MAIFPTVDVCIWEAVGPVEEGRCRLAARKIVSDVLAEIVAIVGTEPEGAGEYFRACGEGEWPEGRIVVFALSGTNEGDCVFVQVLGEHRHTCVIIGKSFDGRDAAWTFARKLADLLGV